MKKVSKGGAFIVALVAILAVYGSGLAFGIQDGGPATVSAIVALALAYIGGQVADNGVKGKFYRPELDRKEGEGPCA